MTKNVLRKALFTTSIFSIFFVTTFFGGVVSVGAQAVLDGGDPSGPITKYTLLEPLDKITEFDSAGNCPLGDYIDTIISLLLGVVAVLAMLMIVMGGIEYMTGGPSGKQSGKDKIQSAFLGLLLGLGAWIILNTINPKLLDLCWTGQ